MKNHASLRATILVAVPFATSLALMQACSATSHNSFSTSTGAGGNGGAAPGSSSSGMAGAGNDINFVDSGPGDAPSCNVTCSTDFHAVVDCNGNLIQQCSGMEGCDLSMGACTNACQAAVNNKQSVGCEYYATDMDQYINDKGACFAAFVANTWNTPAHIGVEYGGSPLSLASFARIPSGAGPSLTYAPFNPTAGIAPGDVVILFLAGDPTAKVQCPVSAAVPTGAQIFQGSGVGNSFRITSDVPVVAYEINPYGGGSAAVTGASLLLPTSVWDTNYVAVMATPFDNISPGNTINPSMNVVAAQDDTHVTMLPINAVQGGGGLPSGAGNTMYTFTLNKGQQAQFTQKADLTGSVIQSDKPIGFMAGHQCMRAPLGTNFCDHGEQMVPPVKALGNEYVGVMWRPRITVNGAHDQGIWHVVGAVDGTQLSYSSPVGGPPTINAGQTADFVTDTPFVMKSQDKDHPFMLFAYMSGSAWPPINPPSQPGSPTPTGYGDADFVISVPPDQYMSDYVFFADPTYPETNLVVVRSKNGNAFEDVTLDCAGSLTGWQPVGEYEWTRIDIEKTDLVTHQFSGVGNCSTGRHEIKSKGRFGLWVWGWGTPDTSSFTANVSYGYPGGMNVQPINTVIIPAQPK